MFADGNKNEIEMLSIYRVLSQNIFMGKSCCKCALKASP